MRHAVRVLAFTALLFAWLALAAGRGGYFDPPRPAAVDVQARDLTVLDGDTLLLDGRELRLLGADTPERAAPWFDADQEPWAGRARDLVLQALQRARRVTVLTSGSRDVHDRELAHVLIDGRALSVLLVEAGLAYETVSFYGHGGYPEIAAEVVTRARRPLPFDPPHRWRRQHRIEPGPGPASATERR